jgi:hypothetical protein
VITCCSATKTLRWCYLDWEGTQVGVVSWGFGRAWANIPIVCSSVFDTKDWINAKTCKQSSSLPASCGDRLTGTLEKTEAQLASSPAASAPRLTLSLRLCCDQSQADFPAETVLTVLDCAGPLFVGESIRSFRTKSGAVSKTAYIANGA